MSALAEALVAAQARAVAALAKQYVGGAIDADTVRADLDSIGLTDEVDTNRLLAAWDILVSAGAPAPSEQAPSNGKPKDEPATDAQMALVKRLCGEKNQPVPDPPLTKAQAHDRQMVGAVLSGPPDPKSHTLARGQRRYRGGGTMTGRESLLQDVRRALDAAYNIAECGEHPDHLLAAENAARKALPALLRLAKAGSDLALAAERLERNPLANQLPRLRDPVVQGVMRWRKVVGDDREYDA